MFSKLAEQWADYFGGTAYGQSGNEPHTAETSADHMEAIGRAVQYGRLAAESMNKGETNFANYWQQCFSHQRNVWAPKFGGTWGQWELCYTIGYNRVRKD
jgi:hypothetical protein